MASQQGFRNVVMYGGGWKIRWSIRLVVVLFIVACGFIPYPHEVGGHCHVLPMDERGIRAQVDGEVTAVYVNEGSHVLAGDPIVMLLARDEVAAIAQKEASLDAAKADLKLLQNGTRPEEIAIAEQKVNQWQTQVNFATLAYEREIKLSKTRAGTAKKVEEAQREKEVEEKELEAAKEHLEKLRNGSREEEIDAADAQVRRLIAEIAYHQESVGLTTIKSPIAGTIVTSNIQERVSQSVKRGDLIAIVHDDSKLRVEVAAEERAASCVEVGMEVKIRFNGTDGRTITGHVASVAPRAVDNGKFGMERIRSDGESWAQEMMRKDDDFHISVYVELDPHDEKLLSGMTGYAKVVIGPDFLYSASWRPIKRFFLVEVWSWLP